MVLASDTGKERLLGSMMWERAVARRQPVGASENRASPGYGEPGAAGHAFSRVRGSPAQVPRGVWDQEDREQPLLVWHPGNSPARPPADQDRVAPAPSRRPGHRARPEHRHGPPGLL